MNTPYESLVRHMDGHGFRYRGDPDNRCIRAAFGGDHGAYHLLAAVDERLLQVFVTPGFRVPDGARHQIAELICRANYGLKIGKLEMDMSDGELRFQAATCLADDTLTDDMIRLVIGAALFTLDRYLPAILSCIYGNEEPQNAVRSVEVSLQHQGELDE